MIFTFPTIYCGQDFSILYYVWFPSRYTIYSGKHDMMMLQIVVEICQGKHDGTLFGTQHMYLQYINTAYYYIYLQNRQFSDKHSEPTSSNSIFLSQSAAAAITLKFHQKHATNKNKHIMKISHINVNIYEKTTKSQQNSD